MPNYRLSLDPNKNQLHLNQIGEDVEHTQFDIANIGEASPEKALELFDLCGEELILDLQNTEQDLERQAADDADPVSAQKTLEHLTTTQRKIQTIYNYVA